MLEREDEDAGGLGVVGVGEKFGEFQCQLVADGDAGEHGHDGYVMGERRLRIEHGGRDRKIVFSRDVCDSGSDNPSFVASFAYVDRVAHGREHIAAIAVVAADDVAIGRVEDHPTF